MIGRGLVESRSSAQRLVMAGQVRVNGQVVLKSSVQFSDDVVVTIDMPPRFVSRGGEKLLAALQAFKLDVSGWVCADVGASTGGFTDCLLQHGAAKVYAIDVGFGILHWKLRNDGRVVCLERTNARYLVTLPEPVSLVTIDASFISLKLLMPVVKEWLFQDGGEVIALIKPQFEAGRQEAQRGEGVIQDPDVHRQVLIDNLAFARSMGLKLLGLIPSPIRGPKGNVEFLVRYAWNMDVIEINGDEAVEQALRELP
jgi:23S rRNA (cytidine1920-2'-O)/16S rRNA (cytidine1409-2'-O)-methyltransferase